jgi:hypothetical protein
MQVAANNVFAAVEDWTGDRSNTCPWRALFDEYVARVLAMHQAWKEHQLLTAFPRPSYREMQGVMHYDRTLAKIEARQLKEDADRLKRERTR